MLKIKHSKTVDKKFHLALAMGFLFALPHIVVIAQETKINFVTEHLPPFQSMNGDHVSGYTTEIVKKLLSQTNIKATFKIYPWSRAFNLAKNKQDTCIYKIARTPARELLFQWVGVITTTNTHFIGLKENKYIKINSLEDAKEYQIAAIRDDFTHSFLLNAGFVEHKNLYVVNNTHTLLKLLIKNDFIDLVIADGETVEYRAKSIDIPQDKFKKYFQLNEKPLDFYLACSLKTDKKIIEQLSIALKTIKRNGEYNKIGSKAQYKD